MKRLPSYDDLKTSIPLTAKQAAFIERSRETIRNILNGTDPRLLLIVGPCSIHDLIAAADFASRLEQLSETVGSQFFIVMRTYCEKSRNSLGWKGMLYDPFLDGSHDIATGLAWTRQLLLDLADRQIPTATEFLDPLTAYYYDDLISWGSIGARTSSSQIHRQLASDLRMPMGIKNGTTGSLAAAINGIIAASHPHVYVGLNAQGTPAFVQSPGNRDVHLVLRGGEQGPNYDPASVAAALRGLEQANLIPRLLIDCSHGNSGKNHDNQPHVFQTVIRQIAEGNAMIRGLLLESHLHAGNQAFHRDSTELKYGVSITDACLDWSTTQSLIEWGATHLRANKDSHNDDRAETSTRGFFDTETQRYRETQRTQQQDAIIFSKEH